MFQVKSLAALLENEMKVLHTKVCCVFSSANIMIVVMMGLVRYTKVEIEEYYIFHVLPLVVPFVICLVYRQQTSSINSWTSQIFFFTSFILA